MSNSTPNSEHPFLLQPYLGYGNQQNFTLRGRVLENERLLERWSDSKIRNLWENLKRIESDEIPGAQVALNILESNWEAKTDVEGYFRIDAQWQTELLKSASWINGEMKLLQPQLPDLPLVEPVEILLPSSTAEFGIISDMDDTVLQTHMTSRMMLRMLYVSFLKGAHQRLPMEGMKEVLKNFTKNSELHAGNPIFYVSNSPWNLYDVLMDFLEIQKLPKGPLMLRDFGLNLVFKSKNYIPHKLITIRHILKTYPKLPFILLGDTASDDADYYLEINEEFPERILAIYIRQTRDNDNARRIRDLFNKENNPDFIIIKKASEILAHAKSRGFA